MNISEEQYRVLVECAPEAIVVVNLESGYFVVANRLAEQLFGMDRERLFEEAPATLSPPLQPDGRPSSVAAAHYLQRAMAGESPTFDWVHTNAAGQEIPCEVRLVRLPHPSLGLVRASIVDIAARKKAEELQKRLGRILDNSSNEIFVFDAETLLFTQVNKGARNNLGYSMQDLVGLTPVDIKPEFDEQQFREIVAPLKNGFQDRLTFKTVHKRKDGSTYPVEVLLRLSHEESPPVFVAIIQDISERIAAEQALRDSQHYNRMLFEESTIGLVLCRKDGEIVDANPAFAAILGRTVEPVLALNFWKITSGNYAANEQAQRDSLDKMGRYGPYENEYIHADGRAVPVRLAGQVLERGGEEFIWSRVEDITDHKLARERIDHLAFHDDLTNLPNRALMQDRLEHAIRLANRSRTCTGVLFLDIDRFKTINDTLGHSIGDHLLRQVGDRLVATVRKADTVARFGGDEFVVIAEQLNGREAANALAEKILDALKDPFQVDSSELFVTASIGIAVSPEDGTDIDKLIGRADIAMYQVKESGRNGYQVYSQQVAERVIQRTNMENELRHALDRNQLLLHYQPILDLKTRLTRSVEALMRWRHPQRGLVKPGEFIPILEDAGMIVPATRWMLRTAFQQCASVSASTKIDLSVAVNFSARCFHEECIADHLFLALEETGLKPTQLIVEITESTLFQESQRVRSVLEEMQAAGIRIALDDFGTGQSSLSHLREFPIDIVKIDRDFVSDVPRDRNDCELVAAIISMAHNLNKVVVAEGVESQAQLDFLRRHGCDAVQGYLFSKPLPGDEIRATLMSELRPATPDFASGANRSRLLRG